MRGFLNSLRSGDPASALVFWRSKTWTDSERRDARRLLAAARDVAREVLP